MDTEAVQARKCSVIGCFKPTKAKDLCKTHYMRLHRHGHANQTRPVDWGSRGKSSVRKVWKRLQRHYSHEMVKEWRNDFWRFAKDVGEHPSDATFTRVDNRLPYGPKNWYWRTFGPVKDRKEKTEYMRERNKRMRANNPDYFKNLRMLREYGVSLDWYRQTLKVQKNVCAICKKKERLTIKGKVVALAIDHCHDTRKARGLLCSKCNQAIGCFYHDPKRLMAAIRYLDAFPAG